MIKKIIKYTLLALFVLLVMLASFVRYLYLSADMCQPDVVVDLSEYPVTVKDSVRECGGNWLRLNDKGLWEAYLHGNSLQRGISFGRMAEDLLYYQEKVFVDQIREIIPSDRYLKFLRFMLVVFNRNLGENVPEEYRREIYGISLSCTDEFNAIGTPYERQLNYHAAHDIGHTMQDYMLVGCSALAAWGEQSQGTGMIVGRNFDFWVGDDFARNKLVAFYDPEHGFKFASIGWPGMTGVLSGMNEKGLSVTINAAKGTLPLSSATPISILAREILQYAPDIDEAYRIAMNHRTFVSESLLIASATDGRAVVIEKTPVRTELFDPGEELIVVTNHYQSPAFETDPYNTDNILNTDSRYRWERLNELIGERPPADELRVAEILRDRMGLGGEDIGLTNEKSLNQSIAHHSVIFRPEDLLMWVSTGPWQSGEFICYDLGRILSDPDPGEQLYVAGHTIPADSLFITRDYDRVRIHRNMTNELREATGRGQSLDEDFIELYIYNNPMFFETYVFVGDYYRKTGDREKARKMYTKALELEIPKHAQRDDIAGKLKKLK